MKNLFITDWKRVFIRVVLIFSTFEFWAAHLLDCSYGWENLKHEISSKTDNVYTSRNDHEVYATTSVHVLLVGYNENFVFYGFPKNALI